MIAEKQGIEFEKFEIKLMLDNQRLAPETKLKDTNLTRSSLLNVIDIQKKKVEQH